MATTSPKAAATPPGPSDVFPRHGVGLRECLSAEEYALVVRRLERVGFEAASRGNVPGARTVDLGLLEVTVGLVHLGVLRGRALDFDVTEPGGFEVVSSTKVDVPLED